MKNVTFLAILLLVAGLSYGLGRRQGGGSAATQQTNSSVAPLQDSQASLQRRADRDRFENGSAPDRIAVAAPFAQNMTAAQRGYEAAQLDLDAALKQIETLP